MLTLILSVLCIPSHTEATRSHKKKKSQHQLAQAPRQNRTPLPAYKNSHPQTTLTYYNDQPNESVIYVVNPLLHHHKTVEGLNYVIADAGVAPHGEATFSVPCSVATLLVSECNGVYRVAFPPLGQDQPQSNPSHFLESEEVAYSPEAANQKVKEMLLYTPPTTELEL